MATWATRDRAEAAEARVAELEAEVDRLAALLRALQEPSLGLADTVPNRKALKSGGSIRRDDRAGDADALVPA